ncbi:MAG: SCO family protein [Bacteroidota bacterium]
MKNSIILYLAIISLIACYDSLPSQTKGRETSSRVVTLPYYQDATFTPYWFNSDSDSLAQFHRISPFKLMNQNGVSITEQTFNNKIYITDFFFTACPGICPKMTKNMGVLQDAFLEDSDVLLLSHSVTPRYDSVSVLRQYADANGVIDDKWHLVTGTQEEIYGLGRNVYFVEENLGLEKDPDDFLHTENFVLIDSNRHIRGIYNGLNKTSVRQLIADVRTLQKE